MGSVNEILDWESELRGRLSEHMLEAGVVDPQSGFVNLDNLWSHDPECCFGFLNTLGKYLAHYRSIIPFQTVIAVNTPSFPLGTVPLTFMLYCMAHIDILEPSIRVKTVKIKPLIWNEWTEAPTRESRFRGNITSIERILIFQDIISTGSTLVQLMCDLKNIGQKDVLGVLTIVDQGMGAGDYILEQAKKFFERPIEFKAIFSLSELLEKARATRSQF